MEESIYSKLPKLKIELSLTTLVVSTLVIIFAFIIPVSIIQNGIINQENQTSSGQVAGANTSKEENTIILPIINQSVILEGQSGVLILMGLFLLGFCMIITVYLITDSVIKHRK